MIKEENMLRIKGASENNLKNINVDIPKNKLVVITGVSGSGKSSLAFDTIFEEGKRCYMESLSSYARMMLGGNEKPKVESIEGLSPTISINQKTTSHNPRSTVGTITEIYDYLRILFARIGKPYCPNGHGLIEVLTTKQIIDQLLKRIKNNDKLQIIAPIIRKQKGTFEDEIEKIKRAGFFRIKVDNIEYSLDEDIKLQKNNYHDIDIIVDRIIFNNDEQTISRIYDSVEQTFKQSNDKVVFEINSQPILFSKSHSCKVCGFTIPELEHRLFSYNSPIGACHYCHGLGFTFEPDENKIIPSRFLSIDEGGIEYFKNTVNTDSLDWQKFNALLKHYNIDKSKPISELTKKELNIIFNGSDEEIAYTIKSSSTTYKKFEYIEGVKNIIKRRHEETTSEGAREYYSKYLSEKKCTECNGKRLSPVALSVKIEGKSIIDITEMSIDECLNFFLNLTLTDNEKIIAQNVLKQIIERLSFLNNVGLYYLSLSRGASTLSGGESQRIRLATQIGTNLTNVIYILDEPSIGLHQKDNDRLIDSLKKLRDIQNSVIVVEHDLETIESADYIVEIGPNAGLYGGELTACGTPNEIKNNENSLIGKYLTNKLNIPLPKSRRSGNGHKIKITGASMNNIKNLDVVIPLGKMICVTGVSGSGKSSLVNHIIVKNIVKNNFTSWTDAPQIKSISGHSEIKKIICVDQDPIGKTPRSNPATYVGVFDDIRDLFAHLPEAKARGYTKAHFSFNVPGGRCEKCHGDGVITLSMHFLPSVQIKCDECDGKRFTNEVLSIKYKGKSIFDVLEMDVDTAINFFENIPSIYHKLSTLKDVGLGYIKLGTSGNMLSGGESQRVKLAKFLQKSTNNNSLVILDEPTTGLHIDDVKKLIIIINRIVDNGSTVIIIEHNLDLIKCADYIIDMGPNGGNDGGKIVATGTPEQICEKDTYTSKYLKKYLYS